MRALSADSAKLYAAPCARRLAAEYIYPSAAWGLHILARTSKAQTWPPRDCFLAFMPPTLLLLFLILLLLTSVAESRLAGSFLMAWWGTFSLASDLLGLNTTTISLASWLWCCFDIVLCVLCVLIWSLSLRLFVTLQCRKDLLYCVSGFCLVGFVCVIYRYSDLIVPI